MKPFLSFYTAAMPTDSFANEIFRGYSWFQVSADQDILLCLKQETDILNLLQWITKRPSLAKMPS